MTKTPAQVAAMQRNQHVLSGQTANVITTTMVVRQANQNAPSLPIVSAIGGMLIPACVYLVFNFGTTGQAGAGVPMATDIAFALGILSLLGNRVPASLKVFLTALAVIDDLGAIIVIAIFYTGSLSFLNLFIALGIFGVLLLLNRLKVHNIIPYLAGGVAMWYFMSISESLFTGLWSKYRPALLQLMIAAGDSPQRYQLFAHEFKSMNSRFRGPFTFTLQIASGRALNNIKGSPIAQDLKTILETSSRAIELMKLDPYEFTLDKQ